MAVVTLYGSKIMTGLDNTTPSEKADRALLGGRVRAITETIETGAADSVGSKYYMGKIPSNAVIDLHNSVVSVDDLGAATAPLLEVGFEGVDSQITADPNALATTTITGATAGDYTIGLDRSNFGKEAWEYVNGVTEDPGGMFDIVISVASAAIDQAGTISIQIMYQEG